MSVSVLVPYGGDCSHRARAWEWVRARYEREHPDWELLEGHCEGEWSKGAAVADAASRALGDVFVLGDADSFVDAACVSEAARLVGDGTPWVMPHRMVYRLNQQGTDGVYSGKPPQHRQVIRRPYRGVAGGGMVVLSRDAFVTVGGIDDRFLGWGGEDESFAHALTTLVGPPARLDADLWHLWHPHPAPRLRGSPQSAALALRYIAAAHVPRLMRALVEHREPEPAERLADPVRFHSPRPQQTVRALGRNIRFVRGVHETTDPDVVTALRATAGIREVP